MIKEGLEVIHEFKCSCNICTRGFGPLFEEPERLIRLLIALKDIDYRLLQGAKNSLNSSFKNLNNRKSPTLNNRKSSTLNNRKSSTLNGYTIDSFFVTNVLELIAYQCSFPFLSK